MPYDYLIANRHRQKNIIVKQIKKVINPFNSFGLYDIEYGEPYKKWVWTQKWFGASISNVNKVNLRIISPINNKLIINNTDKKSCIIKSGGAIIALKKNIK